METNAPELAAVNTNEEIPLQIPQNPQEPISNTKSLTKNKNVNTLDNYFQNLTKLKRSRPDSEENNLQNKEHDTIQNKQNLSRTYLFKLRN